MSNVDLPKPKPSKLKRAVEQIKSGIKNVGKEPATSCRIYNSSWNTYSNK